MRNSITLNNQDTEHQMHISDVYEYISSIHKLQQENPNMQILIGFEVEYDQKKKSF